MTVVAVSAAACGKKSDGAALNADVNVTMANDMVATTAAAGTADTDAATAALAKDALATLNNHLEAAKAL